jgi:hypothetical protein
MKTPLAQELVAEWHPTLNDKIVPSDFSAGSHKRVWWLCPKSHPYEAIIKHRTNGSGCPYCLNRKCLTGWNDLALYYPDVAAEWDCELNELSPEQVYYGNKAPAAWHGKCGHKWVTPTYYRTIYGRGCPLCDGRDAHTVLPMRTEKNKASFAQTHPEFLSEWDYELNGGLKPEDVTAGSEIVAWWKCSVGHSYDMPVEKRVKGRNCSYCSGKRIKAGVNDLMTLFPVIGNEFHPALNGNLTASDISPGSHKNYYWLGEKCGHTWKAMPFNRTKHNKGCHFCSGTYVLLGFNDLVTTHPLLAAEWHPTLNGNLLPTQVSRGSVKKVWWQCAQNHVWEASVDSRARGLYDFAGCLECWANCYISKAEQELQDFIVSLGLTTIQSDRTVLGRKHEIDIYIPSQRVGIEYNGLYWHSEATGKDSQYHYEKHQLALSKGIELIQIWEDDWNVRKQTIKRELTRKLNRMNEYKVLYPGSIIQPTGSVAAQQVSHKEAQVFMLHHNIAGVVESEEYLGLLDETNKLLGLIAYGIDDHAVTIVAHANGDVANDSFTQLLVALEEQHSLHEINIITSNDFNRAQTLTDLGFKKKSEIDPEFSYVVRGKRRLQVEDPTKLPRIWDAGKTQWKSSTGISVKEL